MGPRPGPDIPGGAPALPADPQLEAELRSLLAEVDAAWAALDMPTLAALWDLEDGQPVYAGDEYREPVVGWNQLGRHWGRLGGRLEAAAISSTLRSCRRLEGGLAAAVFHQRWELVGVESPTRHRGQVWVTALLRRRPGGWRFVHHAETPANLDSEEP